MLQWNAVLVRNQLFLGCGQTWQFVNPVLYNLLYRDIQIWNPKLDQFSSVFMLNWIHFHLMDLFLCWTGWKIFWIDIVSTGLKVKKGFQKCKELYPVSTSTFPVVSNRIQNHVIWISLYMRLDELDWPTVRSGRSLIQWSTDLVEKKGHQDNFY